MSSKINSEDRRAVGASLPRARGPRGGERPRSVDSATLPAATCQQNGPWGSLPHRVRGGGSSLNAKIPEGQLPAQLPPDKGETGAGYQGGKALGPEPAPGTQVCMERDESGQDRKSTSPLRGHATVFRGLPSLSYAEVPQSWQLCLIPQTPHAHVSWTPLPAAGTLLRTVGDG